MAQVIPTTPTIEVMGEHAETGLPIFAPTVPLQVYPRDFRAVSTTGVDEFLRFVVRYDPQRLPLLDLLRTTTKGFQQIGELCGIDVIDHTYGLYPADQAPATEHQRIPRATKHITEVVPDFVLCARVPVIHGRRKFLAPRSILDGFKRYREQQGTLVDLGVAQCSYGTTRGSNIPRWIWHDVDARHRDVQPEVRVY